MTSSTQRSVCGARLRLSWRGFRPRDRCLWPADSHLGGQRSYAWGGSVHISPRDDVGRVDPLRTYRTLTWRRSETLLSTRQQAAFASPANLSPRYTETSPPGGLRSFPPERCSMHLAPLVLCWISP